MNMLQASQNVALIGIAVKLACSWAMSGLGEKVKGRNTIEKKIKTASVRTTPMPM